jgi:hypothetical protein
MSFNRNGPWVLLGIAFGIVIAILTAVARYSAHPVRWLLVVLTIGLLGMVFSFFFRNRDSGAHDSFLFGLGVALIMTLLWWSLKSGALPPTETGFPPPNP